MSKVLNRIRQQISSPTGTGGPLILASVAYSNAYQTIAGAGGEDATEYCYIIEEGQDWEIQRGAWTSGSNSLARNTPIMSSIAGVAGTTKMSLAGAATVRVIMDADELSYLRQVRTITGASDTMQDGHKGCMTIYNRATAIAVALAAPSGNSFRAGYVTYTKNVGAGAVTITATGATITSDGVSSSTLVLQQYEGATIFSDGTNYYAWVHRQPLWAGSYSLTAQQQNNLHKNIGAPIILRGYITGLTISTPGAVSTFSVAVGVATDSTAADMLVLSASITKSTSAWAVGSGNGGLDTGTIAVSTWYHVFLIKRPDTGVVDVLISLSPTAPTLPTNYTLFRRIGSIKLNSSSQWVRYFQRGNAFVLDASVADYNGYSLSSGAQLLPLVSLPSGIKVEADIDVFSNGAATGNSLTISAPDQTGPSGFQIIQNSSNQGLVSTFVRTDTSGRVRVNSSAATSLNLTVKGWRDYRDSDL